MKIAPFVIVIHTLLLGMLSPTPTGLATGLKRTPALSSGRFILLIGILLLVAMNIDAYGQKPSDTDTVRTYKGSEIAVTATRSAIPIHASPSPIEVIGEERLKNLNGNKISDALFFSSGAFIRDYGGNGGLKTISIRGLGPEHTLVLLDGNRFNSFQNGLLDLGTIMTESFERIEIVRGGNSALYGSDALGGVVNLISKQGGSTLSVGLQGGVGSAGYKLYNLRFGDKFGSLTVSGGFISEAGDGDYRYEFDNGRIAEIRERVNADFSIEQSSLNIKYERDKSTHVALSAQYAGSDRGVAGPMVETDNGRARQNDKNLYLTGSFRSQVTDKIIISLSPTYRYLDERYVDPSIPLGMSVGWGAIDSYYKNTALGFNAQTDYVFSDQALFIFGIEFARAALKSNDVSDVVRIQKSFYLSSQLVFETGEDWLAKVSLYPTLRYDSFSDWSDRNLPLDAWSPKIGLNVNLHSDPDIQVRTTCGKNFRMPTFNDLYWKQGGNPNLRPEQSVSFDAGFITGVDFFGRESLEMTFFNIDTRDRIIWVPTASSNIWSPENIGRVNSSGLETSLSWSGFNGAVELQVHHALTSALKKNRDGEDDNSYNKQLIYVPKEVATFVACFRYENFSLNLTHCFVSHRFITADNSPTAYLPSYQVTGGNVSAIFSYSGFKLRTKLEVNNLFDADYQVIASYPMPLRSFRFVLGLEY
jgi:outer membrane cobalamin receptor